MADIEVRMKTQVVIVQGAMGTMLGSMGFDGCLPFLNLTEPETVEDLHRRYRDAGADCAVTNTFLATPDRLEEYGLADHMAKINEVGVRLAKRAGFPHVLGAIGPCLVEVEPGAALAVLKARRLNATEAMTAEGAAPSYAAAVEQYAAQATALASAGPDALLVESFVRLDDALAAIDGVRRVTDLPVIATMALTADCLVDPADAAQALVEMGACAVGCNCMDVDATLAALASMRPAVAVPLVARPSAGNPVENAGGGLIWPLGPDGFAEAAVEELRTGATVLGSCCGSTPACTGAIYAAVGGLELPGGDS